MSKITPNQLLKHKDINDLIKGSIKNSISYGIIQITENAFKSEEIMKEIGNSLEKIVKVYENSDLISGNAKKAIPSLETFWYYISFITKYQFEKIDEELLFKGPEYPTELIHQLNKHSAIYGKKELYERLIRPAEEKINKAANAQNKK